jgi:hypothetical protein
MSFCASCLEDRHSLRPVMLNDIRVLLCAACNDEHPRSGRWSFEDGGEPSCGMQGVGTGNLWSNVGFGNRKTR